MRTINCANKCQPLSHQIWSFCPFCGSPMADERRETLRGICKYCLKEIPATEHRHRSVCRQCLREKNEERFKQRTGIDPNERLSRILAERKAGSTYKQIGENLGISPNRVRELESRALWRLMRASKRGFTQQ